VIEVNLRLAVELCGPHSTFDKVKTQTFLLDSI